MKEQNQGNSNQPEPFDLEKRLTAYYGPQLCEQPLSETSWQELRHRLGTQEDTKRRQRFHLRFPRKRSRASIPTSIEDTFIRIAYEVHIPSESVRMNISLKQQISEPRVRNSWFGRHKIRLLSPLHYL